MLVCDNEQLYTIFLDFREKLFQFHSRFFESMWCSLVDDEHHAFRRLDLAKPEITERLLSTHIEHGYPGSFNIDFELPLAHGRRVLNEAPFTKEINDGRFSCGI